jgi:hypothetical protein
MEGPLGCILPRVAEALLPNIVLIPV